MIFPSFLSIQSIDPEISLSSQQFDRSYFIKRIWKLINETDQKRKNGLTENDVLYFSRLLVALEKWSDEELLELADAKPIEFRKLMRRW